MSKTYTLSSARNTASTFAENVNTLENNMEMLAYRKMYYIMFNAITDAMEKIQDAGIILCKAQQNCEQVFMEAAETSSAFCSESSE